MDLVRLWAFWLRSKVQKSAVIVVSVSILCALWVADGSAQPVASVVDTVVLVRQIGGHGSGIIEFSPSGRMLGIVTSKGLAILDPARGVEIFEADFPIEVCEITDQGCAFSRDGRYFAASLNNALVVVDLRSAQLLISNEYPSGRSRWSMGALAFTPDGRYLLIGGHMPQVHLLDLANGRSEYSLVMRSVVGIEVMPDQRTAAIAQFMGNVVLWDWEQNTVVDTLSECDTYCAHLATTGKYLIAGCGPRAIRIWDSRTYEFLGHIKSHAFIGYGFSTSDRTSLLVRGSGQGNADDPGGCTTSEITLISLNTHKAVYSWYAHTAAGILDTAFSPDGTTLATSGYDGVLNIWRVVME